MKVAPGVGNVELREIPEPQPGPGEVLLEVKAAGICGTDLHIYDDEFRTQPPVVMGHEVSGRVVALGAGVFGVREGARVTTETYAATCGSCRLCRSGHRNLCAERRSIGSAVHGGFAKYLVVPATNLHELPPGISDEAGALTEPLACVAHAVLGAATVRAGETAVVAGPGAIGLLTLQVLKASGATVIVLGTDADEARLELARRLGAEHTLSVQREDAEALVREVTLDGLGADVVYECSGAGGAAAALLRLVRRRGRYVQIGLFGRPVAWDLDEVCYRELTVTGSNASTPEGWRSALALLRSGQVSTQVLVSNVYPLSAWAEAFTCFREKRGVKVLLKPGA
ncbi:zinc-dependent alcohol dehydrogenase [Truepera radiovictrix]|nr:alcohol dehydrogenase catalytic domain-containing protein [Truepera radiovictrix]WMT56156.1 alcohol dehydrogenase catalytic domain-containing protein [Truepera radiovictrix]